MSKRDLQYFGTVPLDPGQRDKSVRIEQRASAATVDTGGFPPDNAGAWTTLDTEWMRKFDLGGKERFEAQQLSAAADTMWEMPYRFDMDPDLVDVPKVRRLIYQGRTFDIVRASVIGTKDAIELVTLAKVG